MRERDEMTDPPLVHPRYAADLDRLFDPRTVAEQTAALVDLALTKGAP